MKVSSIAELYQRMKPPPRCGRGCVVGENRGITAPSPRRRFEFSLRTLLLLVTVVGIWTPLLMKAAEAGHDAREAARRICCPNNLDAAVGASASRIPAANR